MKQNFILDAAHTLPKEELLKVKKEKNVLIKHFLVKDENKKNSKKDYYTFLFDEDILYKKKEVLQKIFHKTFASFLKKYHKGGPILFVGLGNSSILGDSFGKKVLDRLIATNQYNDFLTIPKVVLFTPETVHKTGISSFKLIEMVVSFLKPDVIVLLDSFFTSDIKHLNYTLELNNCGLIFKEELRSNQVIDENTFHVPVLSIGYPTLLKTKEKILSLYTLQMDLEQICELVSGAIQKVILNERM